MVYDAAGLLGIVLGNIDAIQNGGTPLGVEDSVKGYLAPLNWTVKDFPVFNYPGFPPQISSDLKFLFLADKNTLE